MIEYIKDQYKNADETEVKISIGISVVIVAGITQDLVDFDFLESIITAAVSVMSGFLIESFITFAIVGIIKQKHIQEVPKKFRTLTGTVGVIIVTSIVIYSNGPVEGYVSGFSFLVAFGTYSVKCMDSDSYIDMGVTLWNLVGLALISFVIGLTAISQLGALRVVGSVIFVMILSVVTEFRLRKA
ncbi:hypothetical protein [Haloarcula sp. K1]|uniref:hypothetical protein n=1 Tax=Haloarcula sp. K1 TaxID=1622207 RepID=UPI0007BC3D85|nr:hypothetical protein [Haloarcula sp. K1]KZX47070.1 hypothetical protein AV929_01710 [Haloarcula sp. K1]